MDGCNQLPNKLGYKNSHIRGKLCQTHSFELETAKDLVLMPSTSKVATTSNTSTSQVTFVWIQDEENSTHGWKATHSSLRNQGYAKEESTTFQFWVPKASYDLLST